MRRVDLLHDGGPIFGYKGTVFESLDMLLSGRLNGPEVEDNLGDEFRWDRHGGSSWRNSPATGPKC